MKKERMMKLSKGYSDKATKDVGSMLFWATASVVAGFVGIMSSWSGGRNSGKSEMLDDIIKSDALEEDKE